MKPINNSSLLKGNVLKDNLIEELNYILVPEEAWTELIKWYGLERGQDPIPRRVIIQGMFAEHPMVEVYLIVLRLSRIHEMDKIFSPQFSRVATIRDIKKTARHQFKIAANKPVRLWKHENNTFEELDKPNDTVQDAGPVRELQELCDCDSRTK